MPARALHSPGHAQASENLMSPRQSPDQNSNASAAPALAVREDTYDVPTVGLWDALGVLRRRLWLFVAIAAASVPAAVLVAYRVEPKFEATAVIRLEDARRALTGGLVEGAASGLGSRSVDPLLSKIEVITSQTTVGVVVDSTPKLRLSVQDVPFRALDVIELNGSAAADTLLLRFTPDVVVVQGRFGEVRGNFGEPIHAGGLTFAITERPAAESGQIVIRPRNSAIEKIQEDLRVIPRELTDVVDVSFTSKDPDRARDVVNRVVQVFQQVNADAAQDAARRQRLFIEKQLAVSDSLLADARRALSAFRARQAGFSASRSRGADGGLLTMHVRRDQLAAERETLDDLLRRLGEYESSSRRAVIRAAIASPQLADNVETRALYEQLVLYETALDSMTGVSAPTNPDFVRTRELIVTTESRLVDALAAAVEEKTRSLAAEIETLDTFRERNEATLRQFTTSEAEEARLQGQVDNARRMTDQLRETHQKAQLAEAVEIGQVEILDMALTAEPVGIGVLPRVAIVLLLGLFAGVGGAFLAERGDRSITTGKQVEALGLPVLGIVPRLRSTKDTENGWDERATPVVEAIRGIRLNLVYAHGTAGPLATTITSPQEGDGKSFVASNLALAFAHNGQPTLVIDGDVRRGGLHRAFNAQRKPGLTDYLLGNASAEEILQKTEFANLHFIGCGTRTTEAPERLESRAMKELYADLVDKFGIVIVDCPPLGAGVDALSLGTIVGNMLLVVRGGRTNRELAEAKLDMVERLPIRLLGAVINAARGEGSNGYYSYYMDGYELHDEGTRELSAASSDPAVEPHSPRVRPTPGARPDRSHRVLGFKVSGE